MSVDRTTPPGPARIQPFDFPVIRRERLAEGGLELISARHGDLPLVTARLVLAAGNATEPAERAGIATLAADTLDTGTRARSAAVLSEEFEKLGVELDTAAGWDATAATFTAPRDRVEPALELFADVVRNATFPAEHVERIRAEQLADLLQRRKEPRSLADDMAARFIFDDGVAYGRPRAGTRETVASISQSDVAAFYRDRYRPASAALVLVGGIDEDEARQLATDQFGDWRGEAAPDVPLDVRPRVSETTIFLVHRPGAVQSEIRIGDVGVERGHADYFPILVMNTILGGAFTSRLNMSLREKHGFTYGARSRFAFRRYPGPFNIQAAVATDVTDRALEEALREMRGLRDEGATDREVDAARDYLRGVLPLHLQTTGQLAARIGDLFTYDLPTDYFRQYRDHIAAVTPDDVQRVARQHLRTRRLAIVVVGDADQIAQPLRHLDIGAVEVHDIP